MTEVKRVDERDVLGIMVKHNLKIPEYRHIIELIDEHRELDAVKTLVAFKIITYEQAVKAIDELKKYRLKPVERREQ